jgi:hypothetical protein
MNRYHYVYRITNKELNKHYYGCRSSNIEPKLDLGIKYFSSSKDKDFMNAQKVNNSIFKYKVIKTFETREEAINLEIKLHAKFEVGKNESFYNRSKQLTTSFSTFGVRTNLGVPKTEECKAKLSALYKGKTYVELYGEEKANEIKLKITNAQKGITRITPEGRLKLSKAKKGVPCFTEEQKQKMSEERKNKIHVKNILTKEIYRTDDIESFKIDPLIVGSTLKYGYDIFLNNTRYIIFKYEFVKKFAESFGIGTDTIRRLKNSNEPYRYTGSGLTGIYKDNYKKIDGMIVKNVLLEIVDEEYIELNKKYFYVPSTFSH